MIFGLKSICCSYDIKVHGSSKVPYVCGYCNKNIEHRIDLYTPCCTRTPFILRNEDAWQCTACDSTWNYLGELQFMDPMWSHREGIDV